MVRHLHRPSSAAQRLTPCILGCPGPLALLSGGAVTSPNLLSRSRCSRREKITADAGVFTHAESGRTARYGEVASKAGDVSLPEIELKTRGFKVIGKPQARTDAKVKALADAYLAAYFDRYPDQGYPPSDRYRDQGYSDDRYGSPPPDDRYADQGYSGRGYADSDNGRG